MFRSLAALGVSALVVGGFVAAAPAADAASVSTSTVRDVATLRCLDSNTSGSVYTLPCNGGNFQEWIIHRDSTSTVEDFSTSRCLDSNTSGQVYTLPCNRGQFQNWRVSRSGGRLVDVATGRCLDSNTAGHVYTLPCNNGQFQNWYHG